MSPLLPDEGVELLSEVFKVQESQLQLQAKKY